jgi:hypothetical protein
MESFKKWIEARYDPASFDRTVFPGGGEPAPALKRKSKWNPNLGSGHPAGFEGQDEEEIPKKGSRYTPLDQIPDPHEPEDFDDDSDDFTSQSPSMKPQREFDPFEKPEREFDPYDDPLDDSYADGTPVKAHQGMGEEGPKPTVTFSFPEPEPEDDAAQKDMSRQKDINFGDSSESKKPRSWKDWRASQSHKLG